MDRETLAIARAKQRTDALKAILGRVLEKVAEDLSLDLNSCRISVYTHDKGTFFLVSRYSNSPTLAKPGRHSYPDSQGLIGKVWSSGKSMVITHLPKDRERWNQKCTKNWNIPAEVATGLQMQARSLLGRRIDTGSGHQQQGIGLIIIESLEQKGVEGTHQDKLEAFSELLMEVLGQIVQSLDAQDAVTPQRPANPRRALPNA